MNRLLMCAYALFLLASLLIVFKAGSGTQTAVFFLLAGVYLFLLRNSEALIAVICAVPYLGSFYYSGLTALTLLLGIVAVVAGWRLLRNLSQLANLPVLLIIVFFSFAAIHLYFSDQATFEFGMRNIKFFIIRGLLPALLIMTFREPQQRFRVFLFSTLLFTLGSEILALASSMGHMAMASRFWDQTGRVSVFGWDPISSSLPFGVAGVIGYHYFLNSTKLYLKIPALLIIGASFLSIVSTGTRQTLIALAVAIMAYTYYAFPSLLKKTVMGLICIMLLAATFYAIINLSRGERYHVGSKGYFSSESFRGRVVTMRRGLETFYEAPVFGAGPGGHGMFIYLTDPNTGRRLPDKEHIHNLFIELLAEHGFMGFGLFMTSLAVAVLRLLKKLRKTGEDLASRRDYSILLALMAFAVVQANISGGFGVSASFISMLIAWISIMSIPGSKSVTVHLENRESLNSATV